MAICESVQYFFVNGKAGRPSFSFANSLYYRPNRIHSVDASGKCLDGVGKQNKIRLSSICLSSIGCKLAGEPAFTQPFYTTTANLLFPLIHSFFNFIIYLVYIVIVVVVVVVVVDVVIVPFKVIFDNLKAPLLLKMYQKKNVNCILPFNIFFVVCSHCIQCTARMMVDDDGYTDHKYAIGRRCRRRLLINGKIIFQNIFPMRF